MPARRTARRCGRATAPSPSTARSCTCPAHSWTRATARRPPASHYPQGLLSCLYRIGRRLPVDCDLHAHRNERLAARQHLDALAPGDLVVYDRGYYSFELLHAHVERGMQAVFRLQRNASHCIRDFVTGASRDSILTVEPSETARSQQPQAELRPCRLRLVKYTAGQTACTLGTTLLGRGALPGRRPGGPLRNRGRVITGWFSVSH